MLTKYLPDELRKRGLEIFGQLEAERIFTHFVTNGANDLVERANLKYELVVTFTNFHFAWNVNVN